MVDTVLRERIDALREQLRVVSSFRHVQLALLEMVDLVDQLRCTQDDPIAHYDTGSGVTLAPRPATLPAPEVEDDPPESGGLEPSGSNTEEDRDTQPVEA